MIGTLWTLCICLAVGFAVLAYAQVKTMRLLSAVAVLVYEREVPPALIDKVTRPKVTSENYRQAGRRSRR
jgi:hypothetical protein